MVVSIFSFTWNKISNSVIFVQLRLKNNVGILSKTKFFYGENIEIIHVIMSFIYCFSFRLPFLNFNVPLDVF